MTKITIQASVKASVEKTWDYYTQPDHITKWNFAIDTWQCPFAANDLRVGGKYMARMEAKDGSFGFDFEATYNEVVENEKINYTIPDGRVVDILFDSKGDSTDVLITFDAESLNSIDLQRDGWQAILNNFKKYTEEN